MERVSPPTVTPIRAPLCRRLKPILGLISLKGVHPNVAKNIFRESVDTICAGRCLVSIKQASSARHRRPRPIAISPSPCVPFHHLQSRPVSLGKKPVRLRFNSAGIDNPKSHSSSTRQNDIPHCNPTHQPHIKTQTYAHFCTVSSYRSPLTGNTNSKIIILSAPTAANTCMMLPVTRI